jgi:hypothetical protein
MRLIPQSGKPSRDGCRIKSKIQIWLTSEQKNNYRRSSYLNISGWSIKRKWCRSKILSQKLSTKLTTIVQMRNGRSLLTWGLMKSSARWRCSRKLATSKQTSLCSVTRSQSRSLSRSTSEISFCTITSRYSRSPKFWNQLWNCKLWTTLTNSMTSLRPTGTASTLTYTSTQRQSSRTASNLFSPFSKRSKLVYCSIPKLEVKIEMA